MTEWLNRLTIQLAGIYDYLVSLPKEIYHWFISLSPLAQIGLVLLIIAAIIIMLDE